MDLEGGVVGRRRVEEALEWGAGEGGRTEVGHGRRRGAARWLLLLGMRRSLLGRDAGRVGVAAGGHVGGCKREIGGVGIWALGFGLRRGWRWRFFRRKGPECYSFLFFEIERERGIMYL